MKIIGIDPGSRIMGYGIIDVVSNKLQHIASGSINVAKGEIPERLRDIFFTVRDLVRKFSPSEAAIEEVFMHKNAQSA
jgi:crossover junction endodeoxyribonuclease RuvC